MASQTPTQGPSTAAQSGQGSGHYPWGCLFVAVILATIVFVAITAWVQHGFNFSILLPILYTALMAVILTVAQVMSASHTWRSRRIDAIDQWILDHVKPIPSIVRFLQEIRFFFGKRRFCISYHLLDRPWAKWIECQLEQAGYSTTLREWGSGDFEDEIRELNRRGTYTLIVLSPDYLDALKKENNRANIQSFRQWISQKKGIPVRVQACTLEGVLSEIRPVDLVEVHRRVGGDKEEDIARTRLLSRLPRDSRPRKESLECVANTPFPGEFPLIKYREKERTLLFTGRDPFLEDLHRRFSEPNIQQAVYGLRGIGKTEVALEYAYRYEHYYHAIIWLDASLVSTLEADCREALREIVVAEQRAAQKQAAQAAAQAQVAAQPQGAVQAQVATQAQVAVQGPSGGQKQVTQTNAGSVTDLKNWLKDNSDWLVILDNCDDPNLAQSVIPLSAKGHVLLTMEGRPVQQAQTILPLPLAGMKEDEGAEFLLRVIKGSRDITPINSFHYALAREISQSMGGLPLGILHAGKYIAAGPGEGGLLNYLDLYKTRRTELLLNLYTRQPGPSQNSPNPTVPKSEFQTIAAAWSITVENLRRDRLGAGELLQFCAYLAPDPIPEEIFRKAPEAILSSKLKKIARDTIVFKHAIEELERFSLISRIRYVPPKKFDTGTGRRNGFESHNLIVHPLVQDVIREGIYNKKIALNKKLQRGYAMRALLAVSSAFPDVKYDTWELCQRYLPHALTCIKYIECWDFDTQQAQRLLYVTGCYLYTQGEYDEAERCLRRTLLLRGKFQEQYNHEGAEVYLDALADLTIYLDALAKLYHAESNYKDAEDFYQFAFDIKKGDPKRGERDLDTAASLNNLGRLYDDWGNYDDHEQIKKYYQDALDIRMDILGPGNPELVSSYNNFGSYYQKQGNQARLAADSNRAEESYAEARKYYELARDICAEKLPPGHPDTILSRINIATIELALGNKAKAEVGYLNIIDMIKKVFGHDHPQVAYTLNTLAEIYRSRNAEQRSLPFWRRRSPRWYNLAEDAYKQAYAIYSKKFEADHPAIKNVVQNYAMLLKEDFTSKKTRISSRSRQEEYAEAKEKLDNYVKDQRKH